MARFDLTGRTALVTGASRGIGHAIAVALAEHGADVAVNSRSADNLTGVRDAVEATGRRGLVVPADVTDRDAAAGMVRDTLAGLGQIDIIVNNAGGTSFSVPFTELRFSGWEKAMRLNVDSVVHVLQAAAPHLIERRSGSVINLSSIAGVTGTPQLAHYGAAKAAVISLTRSLAVEWAPVNVRVNALCPGWTATDLNTALREDPVTSKRLTDQIPMGRWASPEEMVGAAVFLASDAASYLTGHALFVDGGLTAT